MLKPLFPATSLLQSQPAVGFSPGHQGKSWDVLPGHRSCSRSSLCRGSVLGALECRDFIPEDCSILRAQQTAEPIQQLCSMQPFLFTYFQSYQLLFFLFCCHVCVCSSSLWLQKEAGSSDPWALPAVPLSAWLFIAFLSLNCRTVESFVTAFWGRNPEMFTERKNLSELRIFFFFLSQQECI